MRTIKIIGVVVLATALGIGLSGCEPITASPAPSGVTVTRA